MKSVRTIQDTETVVRILHQDWIIDNRLQLGAFTLRHNETYISVNRLSVESFQTDVSSFVVSHPSYQYTDNSFRMAVLKVGAIRQIEITKDDVPLNIDVEVEPRDSNIASHAGIFTRAGETAIKPGKVLPTEVLPLGLSADDVLMEVAWSLIAISDVETNSFMGKNSIVGLSAS